LVEDSAENENIEKIVRKYISVDEMKADEYRYWQSRPVHERMAAVSELTLGAYAMKGPICLVPRSEWQVVRLERSR
jgi:hypothetical protein